MLVPTGLTLSLKLPKGGKPFWTKGLSPLNPFPKTFNARCARDFYIANVIEVQYKKSTIDNIQLPIVGQSTFLHLYKC